MSNENRLVFKKINFLIMFAGLGLLVIGFLIMSMETALYGFGPLGLTVGPLLVIAGFLVQFLAIMYKPKK
jgi:hypothetical protein